MNLKYPTWEIRVVCPREEDPNPFSIFFITNGMTDYCEHELEFNIPINVRQGQLILNTLSMLIAEGTIIPKHNLRLSDIFNMPVYLIETEPVMVTPYIKQVYRVIVPDECGLFPWDNNCSEKFKKQI